MNPTIAQWLGQSPLPRNEARLLLQSVTGYNHAQIITHDDTIIHNDALSTLTHIAQRRLNGEPMAYILGTRAFYGRDFVVSPQVLIPRPETEHLLEAVISHLPQHGRVWDMGTGSGIIAISIALERPDANVYASDISIDALDIAQTNAHRLHATVHWGQGNWFDAHVRPRYFDVIAANPPYIHAQDPHLSQGDLRFEPPHALTDGADGLNCLREIGQGARARLNPNGWLMLEHGYDQGQTVRHILQNHGFLNIATLSDLAGCERITLGQNL